ncbi:MAG: RidA family protein [Angelakisella sp.]|nr:RidA family protein [Angelakisella sp.]
MSVKTNIKVDTLPKAVGPYQQAIEYGGLIYTSAQLPIDPLTNELIVGDIAEQTKRAMENLKTLLEGCGSSMEKLLVCRLYVTDMSLFSVVNQEYAKFFMAIDPPARICVEVSGLAKGAAIEVEATAYC